MIPPLTTQRQCEINNATTLKEMLSIYYTQKEMIVRIPKNSKARFEEIRKLKSRSSSWRKLCRVMENNRLFAKRRLVRRIAVVAEDGLLDVLCVCESSRRRAQFVQKL